MTGGTRKIIAINPGTRYVGIAVFYGPELRDWQVKNLEGKWSKDKLAKAIRTLSSLIDGHTTDILAIKKLHPSRSSANLDLLVSRIKGVSKRKGLRVYEYSIDQIKEYFQPDYKINKRELAEIISSEYPLLAHDMGREQNNLNPYYIRMFEAVALGSLCFHQLDRHR